MSGYVRYLNIKIDICQTNYHIFAFLGIVKKGGNEISTFIYNTPRSEPIAKNWTSAAIDCYRIGCTCSRCNLNKIYFLESSFQCKMKESVMELVRRIGAPKENEH